MTYTGTASGSFATTNMPGGFSGSVSVDEGNKRVNLAVTPPLPTPTFSGLTASPSVTYGATSTTLSGTLSATGPIYPENLEAVSAAINGQAVTGSVVNTTGGFSINYNHASLPLLNVSGSPYTITYSYAGNGTTLGAASDTNTTLTVNQAALTVTANNDAKRYGDVRTYGPNSTAFTTNGLKNGETIGTVTITATNGPPSGALALDPVGSYNLTPSAATGGTFTPGNYDITYVNGTLTVGLPLRLVAEADVQVDTDGPIATAQVKDEPPVTFGVTAGYLNSGLFQIGESSGALTFTNAPNNNVGDVYYVELTATDSATTNTMLVKVTVISTPPSRAVFMFR
jgi:hypothetical protein